MSDQLKNFLRVIDALNKKAAYLKELIEDRQKAMGKKREIKE